MYEIISSITGRRPPKFSVPGYAAKTLMYPIHILQSVFGEWSFLWDPKTVDAVTANRAYSIEKAKSELGYSPNYSLETGLDETIQWYRINGMIA